MAQLRRDPIVGRWVITQTDKPLSPDGYSKEEHHYGQRECPFCYNNELNCGIEVFALRPAGLSANSPGWLTRVVPNKFPALRIEGDLNRQGVGVFDMSNGIGAHEIIIETPYHNKEIPDLRIDEVSNIISTYCQRGKDLMNDKRFKYIMIFKNFGPAAGASLEHPHSQLIALPMIPKNVSEELKGSKNYFNFRGRCIFCDIIDQEKKENERVILESEHFISFCPFVSRFPFEIWILPKNHQAMFFEIDKKRDLISGLAMVMQESLKKLKSSLSNPAFNYIIHTTTLDDQDNKSYHWHIEIIPKLTRIAGFEWGTGFYIVPTPSELAAKFLKNN